MGLNSFSRGAFRQYKPYLIGALLFGLSCPSYPYVRLEFLAWVWMVPIITALKPIHSFKRFLRNTYLAMLVAAGISMSWLLFSSLFGTLCLFFVGAFVYTVPFVCFFLLRRSFDWRTALWTFPFVWTGWEWLYQQTEGSFAWLTIGYTQSNLYWLIQYADSTGVWGISFWLVLFNVLVVMLIEDWQAAKAESNQSIWASRFLLRRLTIILLFMIVLPFSYSAYIFIKSARASSHQDRQLSVLLVQPNINTWQKFNERTSYKALTTSLALTEEALARERADLVIWPESAVPLILNNDTATRELLYRSVQRWNVPLITGTIDLHIYREGEKRPRLIEYEGRDWEVFNASVLLAPQADKDGHMSVLSSDIYRKQVLMPFAERVPFLDSFPSLSKLAVDFGTGERLQNMGKGNRTIVFPFRDRSGRTRNVATPICYEQLYPAKIAEFVRNGAEMLALITNEGWFSKTQGAYQLAAFTRVRAIETRRSIARTANTGLTSLIDPLGRIYAQAPWWDAQTLSGKVQLSEEMSLYVRYTDYFPQTCLWLSLGFLAAAFARRVWQRFKGGLRLPTKHDVSETTAQTQTIS